VTHRIPFERSRPSRRQRYSCRRCSPSSSFHS